MTESRGPGPTSHPTSPRPAAAAWHRFRRRPVALAALLAVLLLTFLALFPALWVSHDPNALSASQWSPPSREHWLGTDGNGRDVLARICSGTQVSLAVGVAGVLVSLCIGVTWGAIAGYLGGRWDGFLMRAVDVLYSMPSVVVILVLMAVAQDPAKRALRAAVGVEAEAWAPVLLLVAGLGSISWLTMARIVRGQVLSLATRPFVDASRALGASPGRILARHILPNTLGTILVQVLLTLPAVMLSESFLSYLGLGVQPPQASLGTLIADGAGQINPVRTYWWLLLGPAAVLVALLLGLSLAGDGLRAALDPRD